MAYHCYQQRCLLSDDFPSPVPEGRHLYPAGLRSEHQRFLFAGLVARSDPVGGALRHPLYRCDDRKLRGRHFVRLNGRPTPSSSATLVVFLLRQGGEIGYHGYNHQPLCLPDTDYGDAYAYNQWPNADAITAAMDELIAFQKAVVPLCCGFGLCAALEHSFGSGREILGTRVQDPHPLPARILRIVPACPMCRNLMLHRTASLSSRALFPAAW